MKKIVLFLGILFCVQTNAQSSKREEGQASVYEVRIRKKNGELIWVVISGAPVYDLNKKVVGSIGIHWDITTRKVREEELKQATTEIITSERIYQKILPTLVTQSMEAGAIGTFFSFGRIQR